ncbi:cytochrome P450 [Bacillus sp. DJP31]|uniref:cytochrome P450 n=1 Tax=Bacillus sp. DJP31 TaxID=3409789 RepID=UPI003BB5C75D
MTELVKMGGFPLTQYINFRINPLAWLYNTHKQGDIVGINPNHPKPSFVVYAPEAIKEILTTKDSFFEKGDSSKVFSKTLGNGLLTSEGTEHQRQRKMIQPAFHKKRIASYGDSVSVFTQDLISTWKTGESRLINQDMMNLTLRIIVKTLFGTDVHKESSSITKAVNDIIEKSAQSLFLPFPFLDLVPTRKNQRNKKGIAVLEGLVKQLIQEATNQSDEDEDHLLQMLLQSKYEDGTSLSQQEIRDQVVTFVIAGHETTANVLSWIWFLLSQNPSVEKKFHEEIDTVLNGENPTFGDVSQLPYTHQIFQEALRLYPAAWIILRQAKEDVQITGHTFPKGSSFLISPYVVHRIPLYFDQPESFLPERFSKERSSSIPNYAYFPFGAGSRGCIGSQFAMMETILVMATIGQHYKLKLSQPVEDIVPEPLLSLRIKGGIQMKVEERKR